MIEHHREAATPPSRVIIAGATGFVGRHLTQELTRAGIDVVGPSSDGVNLEEPASVATLADLLQPDDALVIISALTPDRGRDVRTMMRNLAMGEHLSRAIAQTGAAHVIYLSSDAVYADDEHPVRETSTPNPSSLYGLMHLVRERMLAETTKTSGIPFLILRPVALYGQEDTHNAYGPNRFIRTALGERSIKLFGNGEEKRDHVYIGDLVRLIRACLDHRSSGVLNVATGQAVSFRELAELVAELTGDDVSIAPSPRANPITHRHFDIAAQVTAFPTVRFTPLPEGMAATVRTMAESTETSDHHA